jgi:hypothetical protein
MVHRRRREPSGSARRFRPQLHRRRRRRRSKERGCRPTSRSPIPPRRVRHVEGPGLQRRLETQGTVRRAALEAPRPRPEHGTSSDSKRPRPGDAPVAAPNGSQLNHGRAGRRASEAPQTTLQSRSTQWSTELSELQPERISGRLTKRWEFAPSGYCSHRARRSPVRAWLATFRCRHRHRTVRRPEFETRDVAEAARAASFIRTAAPPGC